MKSVWKRSIAMLLSLALLLSLGLPIQQGNAATVSDGETVATLKGVESVKAEVVAADAVSTVKIQFTYGAEVNGDDYLFIFMNDYKMFVYNVDTKELVNTVNEPGKLFMQPRGAVMDKNGFLWVCGMGNWLYYYNPITEESGKVSFEKAIFNGISTLNLFGLTLGDDGNVYFGTSSRGYFGMCNASVGDPTKCTVTRISPWLDPVNASPDSYYAGYGGLVVRNGYIYGVIEGDQNKDGTISHYFIKYSIKEEKVVDHIDVAKYLEEKDGQYRQVSLVGGKYVLLASNVRMNAAVLVDISGEKMVEHVIEGSSYGCCGFAAEPGDGYAYVTGRNNSSAGIFKIDVSGETPVLTGLSTKAFSVGTAKMLCKGSALVTVEGVDDLPGTSIVTFYNDIDNNQASLVFYNLQTNKTVEWENITKLQGSGNQLRSLTVDATRENIYVGTYGSRYVSQYNVAAGKVTKQMATYSEQSDSLLWYDGDLYIGNYSECTITKRDLQDDTLTCFFELNGSIFDQYRAHALTAGDGKVFLGTVPATSHNGGVLAWHEISTGRTYVAAGPNPTDVYFAEGTVNNNAPANYAWKQESTGTTVTAVEFTGLIANQTVNNIVYKDGLIYGTTTIHGGSGSDPDDKNAVLFVYDVEQRTVLATLDLRTKLGLTTPVEWIDAIAEDPAEEGKFWGVVSDTLFSFTFNENEFSVNEEVSLGKTNYNGTGNHWDHRNIIFDGDYMYVTFPSTGVYMVNRKAPTDDIALLSETVPKLLEMGADGNLYFFDHDDDSSADLQVLRVAEQTQPLVAASVQQVIDDLPEFYTEGNRAQFEAAQALYDSLIPSTQTRVNATALSAERPYQVGEATFINIGDAVSAAAATDNKTVDLLFDTEEGKVVLTDGVTLDLHGFTLRVTAFNANVMGVSNGYITDSSEGNEGLLVVEEESASFRTDNPDLPLYDTTGTESGYRFFDYKFATAKSAEDMPTGEKKFWFQFHFYTNDEYNTLDQNAYDLVMKDGAGLMLGTNVSWTSADSGITKAWTVGFGKLAGVAGDYDTNLFSKAWATPKEGSNNIASRWLYVIVEGLDKVSDGTLTVQPIVEVNGVTVVGDEMDYVKATPSVDVNYGWDPNGPAAIIAQ